MMCTKNQLVMAALAAGLLAMGLAAGYWWAQRGGDHDMAMADAAATEGSERKVLYWYDPMVPDQHFDQPGKSPFMDMQLVPKYADEVAGGSVSIDPGLRQSVGIRTEQVDVGRLTATVRVPGTLAWDLRRESVVSAFTDSLVSRVRVKAPYTNVARGQPLAVLLAPAWSSALAEAQALQQAQSTAARELRSAAQQRLRVLGVPSDLGGDGSVTVYAPHDGVVTEVLAREGQAVTPGTPLFRVNGTATLWLEAAIPQADAAVLRPGTPVKAVVSAVPGQTFDGEIETLLPQVSMASRTQQARIVLRNPGGALAPGMFAEVMVQPEGGAPVPLVPTEALIATGTDSRVIVQDADGGFRPVRVRTGRSGSGRTEILTGLKGGERVVVSGQFLIDSEASLSGMLERLETTKAPDAAAGQPVLHEAEGTVESMAGEKITLEHGPFPTLNMPGMTMAFPLANPDLIKGIQAGDRVRVFVRSGAKGLTVERLEPMGDRP